jgi:hypothetical protein
VISINFYPTLLKKVIERTKDNSSNVRRAAMKLIMEIVNIHVTFFDVSGQDYGSGGGFYSINIIKG